MLKWNFVIVAILFAQVVALPSFGADEQQIPDENVSTAYAKAMSAQQSFTIEMDAASDVSKIIVQKYANKCDNFAEDGEVKKWGLVIEKELDKDRQKAIYEGPRDVKRLCPTYTRLSDDDKKGLWILIVSAMTHYESSCNITEKAKGPNGIAAGLLQLHKDNEAKYSNGCRNGDSASAERSLICGVSMINDQIERGEPLFSANSYWEVLRPRGRSQKARKIVAVIGQYPPCRTQTSASKKQKPAKVSSSKAKHTVAKK